MAIAPMAVTVPPPSSSSTEAPLSPQPKLRRNGKEQSCEPCRKAKLRCDHATPCARCKQRGRVPQCIYHPAPMTKPAAVKLASLQNRKNAVPRVNPMTLSTGGTIGYSRKPPKYTHGYMGSTGHSAIFEENKAYLDEVWDDDVRDANQSTAEADQSNQRQRFCSAILAWLPDRETSEQALKRYFAVCVSIVTNEPMLWTFHDMFWDTYGQYLQEPRTADKLAKLGEELCRNSEAPFRVPPSNAEFLNQFCGSASRWSAVGWLFVTYSIVVATTSDGGILTKNPFSSDEERRNFACNMLECADACLILSDELEATGNILSLILMYRNVVCQSVVVGDTNYELWKRRGAVLSAVTAVGLHQATVQTASGSTLFVEHQKRLFASVFAFDKTLATFLGRPPGLSRHYVSTEMPLDVSEEDLMADGEQLRLAIASLDQDGWNTRGALYPATIARAFLMSRTLRDEILELSLGVRPVDISARVLETRIRCEQTFASLPPILRTTPQNFPMTERDAVVYSISTHFQLDYLHNQFLLERIDHPEQDEARFFEAARGMLDLIITHWGSKDAWPYLKDSMHWAISCYGIPAASALAMELWTSTCEPTRTFVPRANVIQQLSVFVACLDWIRPDSGNHVLCMKVRVLIKRILDRILDPPREQKTTPTSLDTPGSGASSGWEYSNMLLSDIQTFDVDFQEWMNTIDWSRAPGMP